MFAGFRSTRYAGSTFVAGTIDCMLKGTGRFEEQTVVECFNFIKQVGLDQGVTCLANFECC